MDFGRPKVYSDDCFGALCPWWLPKKSISDDETLVVDENDGRDDGVIVVGEDGEEVEDDDVIVIGELSEPNVAFPKTRYQVEGKPSGISTLDARKSLLRQQQKSKGNAENYLIMVFYLFCLIEWLLIYMQIVQHFIFVFSQFMHPSIIMDTKLSATMEHGLCIEIRRLPSM